MKKMFRFDPHAHAAALKADGYVHIRAGLTPEFYELVLRQADEEFNNRRLEKFAIGDKQQALYEFPEGGDFYGELREAVAALTGRSAEHWLLSERHFKTYDAGAVPFPLPHKDRLASEVAVGFSVRVPAGSTLVFYPHDDVSINPFNSSTELRASLPPERLPENLLKNARRVEIQDQPGDVNIFWGNSIWHCRHHPAGTTMLYLKMNSFNCDPLGEDPATAARRKETLHQLSTANGSFPRLVPQLGRRVDYFHRRFNRLGQEVPGVVLWGEKHVSIDEDEFRALQAMDGQRSVADVSRALSVNNDVAYAKIQRLASLGIVDLAPASGN